MRFSWRGLVQHLSLLKGAVELPPYGREERSNQQTTRSDEFLNGFRACDETPNVEHAAVCSGAAVHAVWQVLFCLTDHDAEVWGPGRTPA